MNGKTFTAVIFIFCSSSWSLGQVSSQITQYQEILPVINPGYAGIEDYTDIDIGFRSQVSGFADGPSNFIIEFGSFLYADKRVRRNKRKYKSPYNISQLSDSIAIPNNGIRSSNPQLVRRMLQDSIKNEVSKLDRKERRNFMRRVRAKYSDLAASKHGFNLTLVSNSEGAFTSYLANPTYAYHLPITNDIHVSMGAGISISHSGFDRNKAVVLDPDQDLLYQNYASGLVDNFHSFLSVGFALYSKSFQFSYGVLQLINGNNSSLNTNMVEKSHNIVGGVNISLNQSFLLVPGFYYSIRELSSNTLTLSSRIYYLDNYNIGINYLPDRSVGISLGALFLNKYQLSYAHDYSISNNPWGSSNEIILGIQLRSSDRTKSVIR